MPNAGSDPNAVVLRSDPAADDAGLVVRPINSADTVASLIELYVISGAMAFRHDEVSSTLSYDGWADPGSSEGTADWRIRQVLTPSGTAPTWATIVGTWAAQTDTWTGLGGGSGDVEVTWADGNRNFDNIWTDHLILSYS